LKTVGNSVEEAMKEHVIDTWIAWLSNYGYPITKSSNWIPVIGHPHDRILITREIKYGKNMSDMLTEPHVLLLCSYHILMSFVIYCWTGTQKHGIYLLNMYSILHLLNRQGFASTISSLRHKYVLIRTGGFHLTCMWLLFSLQNFFLAKNSNLSASFDFH